MDAYYDRGGDTLDTAKVYGSWNPEGISLSEVTVGRWVRSRGVRDRVKIITKGCHPVIGQPGPRVGAAFIRQDVAESLRLLQVETIDHWYLHRDNPAVPVAEIIDALEEQVKLGHIRSYGASNWAVGRLAEANDYARSVGGQGFTSSQINWSLAQANAPALAAEGLVSLTPAEVPWYRQTGMPILAWSTLASGVLSHALAGQVEAASEGARRQFWNPETARRVEVMRRLCDQWGVAPTALMLGYITEHPLPGAALVGPKRLPQLTELMDCAETPLPAELMRQLLAEIEG